MSSLSYCTKHNNMNCAILRFYKILLKNSWLLCNKYNILCMFCRMLFMYFFIIKKYNDSTTKAKYLGFAFYYQFQEKKYRMKVPKKSLDKVMKKVRKLTSRKWSVSNSYKAKKIAKVVRGWINYFKIGSILTVSRKLDTVIRYRFRMCIWKHWKNPKTRYKNLVKLGISKKNARCAAGFHGYA